ncbi:unnamed protein product [Diplocarpon coronariae]
MTNHDGYFFPLLSRFPRGPDSCYQASKLSRLSCRRALEIIKHHQDIQENRHRRCGHGWDRCCFPPTDWRVELAIRETLGNSQDLLSRETMRQLLCPARFLTTRVRVL